MISILDFGSAGNVRSVANALARAGARFEIVDALPSGASGLIIPGVGAFAAVQGLKESLGKARLEQAPYPVLGICLGMQALFEESEEDKGTKGLGTLRGKVRKLHGEVSLPQLGWNQVKLAKQDELFNGIPDGSYFYYANSYACFPEDRNCVLATSDYGHEFPCAVGKGRIWGVQFHPEKSGKAGQRLLENFCAICAR